MNIQLAVICLLTGSGIVYMFLSLIGIARFPDFFTRLHAQGVGDTLGAFLILAGMMVAAGANLLSVKLLLIFVVIVLTNPLGTNLMMIAAVNKEDYQGYRTLLHGESAAETSASEKSEKEGSEGTDNREYEDSDANNYETTLKHEGSAAESIISNLHDELESNGADGSSVTAIYEHTDADVPAKSNSNKKKSRRRRKPSMSMNRSELAAAAEKRGITVPEGATKREILSLIYPEKSNQDMK